MVWLTSQSVWLLVVGCLSIAIAVAFGSRYLVLWILPEREREEAHSIAAALMTAFAAAFALLTALTLANEVSSLSSAQTTVSSEAAAASTLAWVVDQSWGPSGPYPNRLGELPRGDANL
jgi:lipid-A-disaccharide synthase-like uncharacterized protein